jgi:hypothetical protein
VTGRRHLVTGHAERGRHQRPELSGGQVDLLRFFAGHDVNTPRRIQPSLYHDLAAQGLIERHGDNLAYQITERGQQVIAEREDRL